MPISRAGAGAAGKNGLTGSNPVTLSARAAQGPHATEWNLVTLVLPLRLRACLKCKGQVAQGACSPRRYRPSRQARERAAAALAAAGARVRLPPLGGLGAEAGQGTLRLLRVLTIGNARSGPCESPDCRCPSVCGQR